MRYSVAALGAFASFSSICTFASAFLHPLHPESRAFVLPSCASRSSSLYATLEPPTSSSDSDLDDSILSRITDATTESKQWAESFDLTSESGAAFYALFSGIRSSNNLGLRGKPFYLKSNDVRKAMGDVDVDGDVDGDDSDGGAIFDGFFTFDDLVKALEDDFLDADRGSTDNRKGWKVSKGYY